MTTDVARLNGLELEKLHLTDDYINLMLNLEAKLEAMRLCLSKTKSIVGFSAASASLVDLRDMEATTKIQFNKSKNSFSIESNDESEPQVVNRKQKTEKPKEKKPTVKNYKPFGEFEPLSAKQARELTEKAILLACDLATVQEKLRQLKSKK